MTHPLFPFYGSKWRDARRYPAPGALVVEPFAGSAGYSLWHAPARVELYDVDPIVVGVWSYLLRVTPRELLALPDLEPGQSTDDLALPQEARWLIGFWLNRGSAAPKKTQTAYSRRTDRAQLRDSDDLARLLVGCGLRHVPYAGYQFALDDGEGEKQRIKELHS